MSVILVLGKLPLFLGGWILVSQGEKQLCQVLSSNEKRKEYSVYWCKTSILRRQMFGMNKKIFMHSGKIQDPPAGPEENYWENNSSEEVQSQMWGVRGQREIWKNLWRVFA